MSGLIYDEKSLVDSQIYKYDKYRKSRLNKYTGDGRTPVTYFNINDSKTTTSLGMETHYQILGNNSPLRYDQIEDMFISGMTPITQEEGNASTTAVRNLSTKGTGHVIPGTIMPKENDFFIVKHIEMNHVFRVTQVTQDGLNTDGSYAIAYELFSTNVSEIDSLRQQVVGRYVMDLQTIGGSDLTPVIGIEDYELRNRLIKMMSDMVESYKATYYDSRHNCFICKLNSQALFDVTANMFMAKHGTVIIDGCSNNVVLNMNKINDPRMDQFYQRSPYKWIERECPIRYLDTFKYYTQKGWTFPDSSFAGYGTDVDVMIPTEPWCDSPNCDMFFPMEVYKIFDSEQDNRACEISQCRTCECRPKCQCDFKLKRYDYISIIHDYIHGKITSIQDLSLYTGDQLFDNSMSTQVYLWTPIIIHIIQETLKIK